MNAVPCGIAVGGVAQWKNVGLRLACTHLQLMDNHLL